MNVRFDRRQLLGGLLAASGFGAPMARAAGSAPRVRFVADPFSLGVASGYPTPDGFSLWTRLAPIPLVPGGGLDPEAIEVRLEVAQDETFSTIVHSVDLDAFPELGHSVHSDVSGLQPDRWYFYRFQVGDAQSPIGRTRTAPATDTVAPRVRFAIGSCQHYEQGWYNAHRHLLDEDLDLMLFLGDYIYEESWGDDLVRRYQGGETRTLDDYRVRYAQHRTDPHLQALHGAVPWLVTWDDHEVDNDWAGDQSEHLDPAFLMRRAAAFQAWYEHMPVPRWMMPRNGSMTLYSSIPFGTLARFTLLDDRQYRTPQACPDAARGGGSNVVDAAACADLNARERTLLGAAQERWLDGVLAASRQQWNLVAQQTLVAPADVDPAPGRQVWTDGWEGYPEARKRLLSTLTKRKVSNPVLLGGDVHSTYVSDLRVDPLDPRTPVVAAEFCGTSISSQGGTRERSEKAKSLNPHLHYANGWQRGYLTFELTTQGCAATVRAVDVKTQNSPVETVASFQVQTGRAGIAT